MGVYNPTDVGGSSTTANRGCHALDNPYDGAVKEPKEVERVNHTHVRRRGTCGG